MTEVEIRSFLDAGQYQRLLRHLGSVAQEVLHTKQITYYLDCKTDTRVQISETTGKVWQKGGRIHDPSRVEAEAHMSRESAAAMLTIFQTMGHDIRVGWFRERRQYRLNDFTVCLDHTIGYGMILEAELMCDEVQDSIDRARQSLSHLFEELSVPITSRDVFDRAFEEYVASWKDKTSHLTLAWLDSAS